MKLDAIGARQDYLLHQYKKGIITAKQEKQEMTELCKKVKELKKKLKQLEE